MASYNIDILLETEDDLPSIIHAAAELTKLVGQAGYKIESTTVYKWDEEGTAEATEPDPVTAEAVDIPQGQT